MGRFFRTAAPQYIQDFIYQPDWNYLQASLMKRQTDFDNVNKMAELLGGQLKVPYLDFDKGKVTNSQEYYNNEIDTVTNDLYNNKIDEREAQKRINNIARTLQEDISTGILGSVVNRYNNFLKLDEINKDSFKESPEDANMFKNYFYNKLQSDTENNPYQTFSPQQMVNLPRMTDKEFREIYEKAKADISTYIDKNGYKHTVENISEDDIMSQVLNIYGADPRVKAYLQQQAMLGDTRYFNVDENGNVSQKPFYRYFNKSGEEISQEQADKLAEYYNTLSDKDKKDLGVPYRQVLNMDNPFISQASGIGNIYGYNKDTLEETYGLKAKIDYGYDVAKIKLKHKNDMERDAAKAKAKKDLAKFKHNLENGIEEGQNIPDFVTTINNIDVTPEQDKMLLQNVTQNDLNKAGSNLLPQQREAYNRFTNAVQVSETLDTNELINKLQKDFGKTFILNFDKNLLGSIDKEVRNLYVQNPGIDKKNFSVVTDNILDKVVNQITLKNKNYNLNKKNEKEFVDRLKYALVKRVVKESMSNLNKGIDKNYKDISSGSLSTSQINVAGLSQQGQKEIGYVIEQDVKTGSQNFQYRDNTGRLLSSEEVQQLGIKKDDVKGGVGVSNYGKYGVQIITPKGVEVLAYANKQPGTNGITAVQNWLENKFSNPETFSNKQHPIILNAQIPLKTDIKDLFDNATTMSKLQSNGTYKPVKRISYSIPVSDNKSLDLYIDSEITEEGRTEYKFFKKGKNGAEVLTPDNIPGLSRKKAKILIQQLNATAENTDGVADNIIRGFSSIQQR